MLTPKELSHGSDVTKPLQRTAVELAAERAKAAVPLSAEELARRAAIGRRLSGADTAEDRQAEAQRRLDWARENARAATEHARIERERDRPRLTNPLDPGPDPSLRRRARISRRPEPEPEQLEPEQLEPELAETAPRQRGRRRKGRAWHAKRSRRQRGEASAALNFAKERQWTRERSQQLATRTKRNDRIIAHPASAHAALMHLPPWSQAAVRRVLRAQRWTLADEAGRRHVSWWATMEEFARPHAYSRPRQYKSSTGATKFAGIPRFGLRVAGWTQPALAITLSGAATSSGGADPIDVKTVQRHTDLAVAFGGVQKIVRNPDAPDELRGRPTPSNPRGWPINEYWIPAPQFMKPGFSGPWFGADGQPRDLREALALALEPKAKRPRRVREAREREQPPPTA